MASQSPCPVWIGLRIPDLPLLLAEQSLGRSAAGSPVAIQSAAGSPVAVHEAGRALQVNASARHKGVVPGIGQAGALGHCPELHWVARMPEAENDFLRRKLWWLSQWTPKVCREDSLLLAEVSGSLRLFGGLESLIGQMTEGMRGLETPVHIAAACTPRAAAWLSWHNPPQIALDRAKLAQALAGIDIECLRPYADSAGAHRNLSMMREGLAVHRLKELLQLPRQGLRQRLGAGILRAIDQALGRIPDPRSWEPIPDRIELSCELAMWSAASEQLLPAGRKLLHEACGWLRGRQRGVALITLQAMHRPGTPPTPIALRAQRAHHCAARYTLLLAEKLQQLQLPGEVSELRLQCGPGEVIGNPSANLFPLASEAEEEWDDLLERLRARLGRSSIRRLSRLDDHRPEFAHRLLPLEEPPGKWPAHATEPGLPRPIWFLSRPLRIEERRNRPFWHSPLRLLAGPERIETGWWDGHEVARDYFIACDEEHTMYWIYRERSRAQATAAQGWFIHGYFG